MWSQERGDRGGEHLQMKLGGGRARDGAGAQAGRASRAIGGTLTYTLSETGPLERFEQRSDRISHFQRVTAA